MAAAVGKWQETGVVRLAAWLLDRSSANAGDDDAVESDGSSIASPGVGPPEPLSITLTPRQAGSAARALDIIEKRRGVLLADRVGEGKTYIAIALIESMLARGASRVLVTGPAALRPQWAPLLRAAATARNTRMVRPDSPTPDGSAVTWLSHTMLSLGRWPAWLEPCDLVVVDEAHAMRNPNTRRYRSLAWLCRKARVVLLTATPINNTLLDLYHELRLFIGDGRLADLGVPDLGAAMREATRDGGQVRAPLDGAIAAVTVRQASRQVRAGEDPGLARDRSTGPGRSRPERVEPVTVRYDMEAASPGLVGHVLGTIQRLELAAFGLGRDPAGNARAARELLRFGLIKRFESSPAALLASLSRLATYLDAFADAAAMGYHLRPGDRRGVGLARDPAQLILAPLALRPLRRGLDGQALVRSARSDADSIRIAVSEIEALERPHPKTTRLVRLLREQLADPTTPECRTRKVVIFTEFRDTAIDLWMSLRSRFRVGLIHGGGAYVGSGAARRLDVVARFAPGSSQQTAGSGRCGPIDAVDVLVATDVLAEGFNLQDASDVIAFDLPWNPVRLLQRIGRIDRAGSPHAVVYCHTFVPDRSMDLFLRLVDRIATKLDIIRSGLGDNAATGFPHRSVRSPPRIEAMTAMLRRMEARDPQLMDDIEADQYDFLGAGHSASSVRRNGPSTTSVIRAAASPVAGARERGVERDSLDGPRFARTRLAGLTRPSWIVVAARGQQTRLTIVQDGPSGLRLSSGWSHGRLLLEQILHQHGLGAPTRVAPFVAREIDLAAEWPGAAAAVALAGDVVERDLAGAASARARLISGLLKAVAREPGGPDERLCARTDDVVARLRAGVSIGMEYQLADILRRAARSGSRGSGVVDAFERVLCDPGDALAPLPGGECWQPLAVIELTPPVGPPVG